METPGTMNQESGVLVLPLTNELGAWAGPSVSLGCDVLIHKMWTAKDESLPVSTSTLVHWED